MGEPLRIGTAERQAAITALDEHLSAGRLGIEEYAERSATAANAVYAHELRALFTDLPQPHPELPDTALAPVAAVPRPPSTEHGGFLRRWGPGLVAIAPVVAVALFFLTRTWVWFLLVPLAVVIVYGAERGPSG